MNMYKIIHLCLFFLQYTTYYLLTPLAVVLYSKKYPWIISERGNDARDNGYTMFLYLRHEQPYINAYYLINKKSADYRKVKRIGKVVKYKSFKHWLLYRVAECRMSTHLAAFAPGNYIGEWFKHHKQGGINVFLQHGITHNEFLSNYFEHNGSDIFICGSKIEYDFISQKYHYPINTVVYTGFSRFDLLHEFNTKNQILIMPSWRNYLHRLSKEDFIKSTYFKTYNNLLKNKKLISILETNGIKVVFYIHYSLQAYCDCFKEYSPNIIVADFNNFDVQNLLKESNLLITDYSSVFFDFAYMRKPLLYYQFDYDDFYGKHYQKSYFNHHIDGFGDVVKDEIELVEKIHGIIKKGFKLEEKFNERIARFFPLFDSNNSKRIFDAIISKHIEKLKYTKTKKQPTFITFTGDDYGRNNESSLGMNEAYKKGYIQQTSFMVNRNKDCYKYTHEIPSNKIIFHYNILEGNKTYDDSGEWFYFIDEEGIARRLGDRKTFYKINKKDKQIIKNEAINQVKKFKEFGYHCIAFDSHGHMHNRLPIAKFLIPICKDNGFKVARLPMNLVHKHLLFDLTYKKYVIHLYKKNFITTDYFGSCYDLIHTDLNKYCKKTIEIMTHPFICEDNYVVNRRDIDFELIKKYINLFNVHLIDFNDLLLMAKHKNGKV